MTDAPTIPSWGGARLREDQLETGFLWWFFLATEGVVYLLGFGYVILGWPAAAAVVGALWLGAPLAAVWVGIQGRLAVRATGARPLSEGEAPRLRNLVMGLSADMGIAPPPVRVVPKSGPNAMVCSARGPLIAVTQGLLDTYTRTELEAVVAHCLVRIYLTDLRVTAVAVAFGLHRLAPRVGDADDVRAAAITRFPPSLASAMTKTEPATGRFAPLWFVAAAPSHVPVTDRVGAVADL